MSHSGFRGGSCLFVGEGRINMIIFATNGMIAFADVLSSNPNYSHCEVVL